jgi:hypothetical protein
MLLLEFDSFRPLGHLHGCCHHAFQSHWHASVTFAFVCRFDECEDLNRFGFADRRLTCPEELHDFNRQPFIVSRQRNLLLAFRAEDGCTEACHIRHRSQPPKSNRQKRRIQIPPASGRASALRVHAPPVTLDNLHRGNTNSKLVKPTLVWHSHDRNTSRESQHGGLTPSRSPLEGDFVRCFDAENASVIIPEVTVPFHSSASAPLVSFPSAFLEKKNP